MFLWERVVAAVVVEQPMMSVTENVGDAKSRAFVAGRSPRLRGCRELGLFQNVSHERKARQKQHTTRRKSDEYIHGGRPLFSKIRAQKPLNCRQKMPDSEKALANRRSLARVVWCLFPSSLNACMFKSDMLVLPKTASTEIEELDVLFKGLENTPNYC